jgi:hypothetical protein
MFNMHATYRLVTVDAAAAPSLARVSDDKWERYNYIQAQWFPANATAGDVLYSGDWEPCTEGDAARHIAAWDDNPTAVVTP